MNHDRIVDADILNAPADEAEKQARYWKVLDPASSQAEEWLAAAAKWRKEAQQIVSEEVEVYLRGDDEGDASHYRSA